MPNKANKDHLGEFKLLNFSIVTYPMAVLQSTDNMAAPAFERSEQILS